MALPKRYDHRKALIEVRGRARKLSEKKVDKLRAKYQRMQQGSLNGPLLRRAERGAWRAAVRAHRAKDALPTLRDLAAVSAAARNAGLAVLVRDLIAPGRFRLLTRPWRTCWLPIPTPQRKEVGA